MSDELPLVTVLIPARNEEADIAACLEHVLAQDYPHNCLEVVLVDGASVDATVEVAQQVLLEADIQWQIVDSPLGTTPSNLNTGLAAARGEVLCRVDARSLIPENYVSTCAGLLESRTDVAVTGGAQVALARGPSVIAIGIARALNNRFAMGGARYRAGARSGPSDTVYLGAFRTSDLRMAGGWDQWFLTNQDYELNRRMAEQGTVWFQAGIPVGYRPRTSLGELARQYHRFGRWKVRYWCRKGERPQPRQWLLLAAPPLATGIAVAIAFGPLRSHAVAVAAFSVVGALSIEAAGTHGPDGGLASRLVAVAAMGAVAGGWVSGIWRQLFIGGEG